MSAEDRWSGFSEREKQDIHHALRMLLKHPMLGSDERGPIKKMADEIWDAHAARVAEKFQAKPAAPPEDPSHRMDRKGNILR